jgi:hypothetical protein
MYGKHLGLHAFFPWLPNMKFASMWHHITFSPPAASSTSALYHALIAYTLTYRISCSHVADGKKLTRTDTGVKAKYLLLLSIVTELQFGRQILEKKTRYIKFQENPSSRVQVVPWGHDEASSSFRNGSQMLPKTKDLKFSYWNTQAVRKMLTKISYISFSISQRYHCDVVLLYDWYASTGLCMWIKLFSLLDTHFFTLQESHFYMHEFDITNNLNSNLRFFDWKTEVLS